MPLLECVPNVSEGRRPEVVDRLAAAVTSVEGVYLLDRSSDPDHHRTVLTLAGEPEPLVAALLALYETALETIDLTRHEGCHPRLGAVDVVPFVPLGATPMRAAVAVARELGRRVAARFELPVFLYEEAALLPERRLLAPLRRGGFEGLGERLLLEEGAPDFGPAVPHPTAGATVIGARFFLVAFNAYLDPPDLSVAREVAAAVRESGGGLPAVRALGLALPDRGAVQVSMNLVDYRVTSIARALAEVRRLAGERGCRVSATEIVGLVPEEAVWGAFGELIGHRPSVTASRLGIEARLRSASGGLELGPSIGRPETG